jgi:hypothetical protein
MASSFFIGLYCFALLYIIGEQVIESKQKFKE